VYAVAVSRRRPRRRGLAAGPAVALAVPLDLVHERIRLAEQTVEIALAGSGVGRADAELLFCATKAAREEVTTRRAMRMKDRANADS
jgi:hypothetical protein